MNPGNLPYSFDIVQDYEGDGSKHWSKVGFDLSYNNHVNAYGSVLITVNFAPSISLPEECRASINIRAAGVSEKVLLLGRIGIAKLALLDEDRNVLHGGENIVDGDDEGVRDSVADKRMFGENSKMQLRHFRDFAEV